MGIKQGRLYRPQPPDFFSSPNIIATLDRTNDIVHYRKDIVQDLPWTEQRKVYYLEKDHLELDTTPDPTHGSIWN
jgi:hypothetical protein